MQDSARPRNTARSVTADPRGSARAASDTRAPGLSRPAILPKPIGARQKGAISLGFERRRGFYELVCARFAPAGSPADLVSVDSGYVDAGRRFAGPPHRKERKTALLIFLLELGGEARDIGGGLVEVARGGAHSWCHSLYRLNMHRARDGAGNKWLATTLGLSGSQLNDPFSGVLRFIQCRQSGQEYVVHLDTNLFDPHAVMACAWQNGEWTYSAELRAGILTDLRRQVPRWRTPLPRRESGGRGARSAGEQQPSAWEDVAGHFRYVALARTVRMVGLNHQVFRNARSAWKSRIHGRAPFEFRQLASLASRETEEERHARIAREVDAALPDEPLSEDLEELSVFIGSAAAHASWERATDWRPEPYESSRGFWTAYLRKVARLRPAAKVRLFAVDDVSPLTLNLVFSDGSSFLKWAPAMFGAYHPGNPGWNLWWNREAAAPPHFREIVEAIVTLEQRAERIRLAP